MADKRKQFYNAGKQAFHLRPAVAKDGKEVARVLAPEQTIEALDEAEETLLSGYHLVKDLDKFAPGAHQSIDALKDEILSVQGENAKLRARLAELEDPKASGKKAK